MNQNLQKKVSFHFEIHSPLGRLACHTIIRTHDSSSSGSYKKASTLFSCFSYETIPPIIAIFVVVVVVVVGGGGAVVTTIFVDV